MSSMFALIFYTDNIEGMRSLACLFFLLIMGCGASQSQNSTPSPFLLNPTLPVEQKSEAQNKKILLVGDDLSMNKVFAQELESYFSEFGKHCQKSSSFQKLEKHHLGLEDTKKLQDLLEKAQPNHVIFALGTHAKQQSNDFIVNRVTEMLTSLSSDTKCYWVTPTYVSNHHSRRVRRIEKAIIEALDSSSTPCQVISTYDSMKSQQDCASFLKADGIHHTRCGSSLWAEEVFSQICN